METLSALLAICAGNSPGTGEFPAQRPVALSFDVFFDLRLNKRLSEQSWGWWFETLSCPLWRYWYLEKLYIEMSPNILTSLGLSRWATVRPNKLGKKNERKLKVNFVCVVYHIISDCVIAWYDLLIKLVKVSGIYGETDSRWRSYIRCQIVIRSSMDGIFKSS